MKEEYSKFSATAAMGAAVSSSGGGVSSSTRIREADQAPLSLPHSKEQFLGFEDTLWRIQMSSVTTKKYAERDPITALKKYLFENGLASEAELKSIDNKLEELIEDAVEFSGYCLMLGAYLMGSNAEKKKYAERDPITALKKYLFENGLASEAELKSIDNKLEELIEDAVEFSGYCLMLGAYLMGSNVTNARNPPAPPPPPPPPEQLLRNVFVDPRGFGIGPDGKYRCEDLKFTEV
ncbi:hypothetical protein Droror1_Dr00027466 [Drosera rotundifolia]